MIPITYQVNSCTESRKNIAGYSNDDPCLVNSHQTQINLENVSKCSRKELVKYLISVDIIMLCR